jgi:hypothetical protein
MVHTPPPSHALPSSSAGHAGPKLPELPAPELPAAASLGVVHVWSTNDVDVPPAPLLLPAPPAVQTPPSLQALPTSPGRQ